MNIFEISQISKKDEAVTTLISSINSVYGQKIIKKGAKK
jgi:DNA replicative helicase MCM subunit Mcm2 (Cdc46/Mcm family)